MMKNSLILAAALAFSSPVALGQSEPSKTEQIEGALLTVSVKGMVCDFCARAVTKVFGKNDAVENVHVDLDNGEIHIGLKSGANLSDDEVEALVRKSGYAMVSVTREVS